MQTYSTIVNFFQEGGFFMYPIALVMAVGMAIALERWLYLTKELRSNRKMWDQLMPALQGGKYPTAMSMASKSDVAICKVLNYGLSRLKSARRREDIEMAMEEGLMEI
ncbi:MAG TPA: flagellar motor protein MotA, partial [Gammaproteobacteria bacterium]|nr:flagellar motor protein MotA [Gammaproteobacteria bacterium]